MSSSSRYLVYGFFGGWNSGDEAILKSVRLMLERVWEQLPGSSQDLEVTGLCTRIRPGFESTYMNDGIRVLETKQLKQLWSVLGNHQLLIGGGQMITGDRSYKHLVFLWMLAVLARIRGRRACMIGIGVEGVHRPIARWLCRRIVAQSNHVGCRDAHSYQLLQQAGCDMSRLRLTADVVLSRVLRTAGQYEMRPDGDSRRSLAIGIHCSPLRDYSSSEESKEIALVLADAFPDMRVILVSNDARPQFDAGLLARLEEEIDHPRIEFQPFTNVDKVISVYANATCVVSVRMHPLILALIHGRSVVGIDRSNKVRSLAERLGFGLYDPSASSPSNLVTLVRNAIESGAIDLQQLPSLAMENLEANT